MIKVITKGIKEITCRSCNSLLEYSQDEVGYHHINWDYYGDHDIVKGIKCPVCKTIVKVK